MEKQKTQGDCILDDLKMARLHADIFYVLSNGSQDDVEKLAKAAHEIITDKEVR